jgi:hypothetical protein
MRELIRYDIDRCVTVLAPLAALGPRGIAARALAWAGLQLARRTRAL